MVFTSYELIKFSLLDVIEYRLPHYLDFTNMEINKILDIKWKLASRKIQLGINLGIMLKYVFGDDKFVCTDVILVFFL